MMIRKVITAYLGCEVDAVEIDCWRCEYLPRKGAKREKNALEIQYGLNGR